MDTPVPTASLDAPQLARLNRLATMARLIAGLAHELNNTLQVVSGLVELLADRPDLPADAVTRLQKIGGQADKATTAIRQVIGYTRETAGTDAGVVDVAGCRRSGARAASLPAWTAWRSPSASIRPHAIKSQVRGDERQLAQALLNLVMNAEEALAGHPERRLRIALAPAEGAIQVHVEDSGPGCPAGRFAPGSSSRSSRPAVPIARSASACRSASRSCRRTAATCGCRRMRRERRS